MANDEVVPVSDETKDYLDEVKKGKPRKFAMICKGTAVISLVVYKKGGIEKRKKEAKETGRGQFYFGTVRGKGIDINFVLARSDGFESAPVKNTVLKNYLSDAADFTCKPIFEIVDAPEIVLDDEDPLVARFLKSQELALALCDRLPERAGELSSLCREIGGLLQQEPNEPAAVKIEQLESLLASLKTANESSPVTTPPTGNAPASDSAASETPTSDTAASNAPVSDDNAAAKLAEALKKLKPLMDRVINSEPDRKTELHGAMATIVGLIKAKENDQAKLRMMEFATLLKSLVAQTGTGPDSNIDQRKAEFLERRDALQPRLIEAQKKDREKATKLGTVWDYALGQADSQNFDNAIKALERLSTAIDGVLLTTGGPTTGGPSKDDPTGGAVPQGVVTAAVTRLELQQVRLAAMQGVTQLEAALRATEDPVAIEIAGVVSQLARSMPTELEAILERFDQAVKAQDTASIATLKGEIRSSAKAWLTFIEQNADSIAGCEANPWNIPVRIVQPIRGSLSSILKIAA